MSGELGGDGGFRDEGFPKHRKVGGNVVDPNCQRSEHDDPPHVRKHDVLSVITQGFYPEYPYATMTDLQLLDGE